MMMRIFAPVSQDIWPSGAAVATISYPSSTSHQINMYGNNHWDRVPRSVPNEKAIRAKTTETVENKMADKKRKAGILDGGTGPPWIKDLRDRLSPKAHKKSAGKKSSAKSVPKAVQQKLPTPKAGKEVEKWKPWKPPDERPGKKKMKIQKEKVGDSKPGGLVAWLADWLTSTDKQMKNSNSTADGERRQEPFNIDLGITFRERERDSDVGT
jgi:hypothetical protein